MSLRNLLRINKSIIQWNIIRQYRALSNITISKNWYISKTKETYKQIPYYREYKLHEIISNHQYSTTNEELNLVIDQSTVTRLKQIMKDNEFLRVIVEGGGCSGFQYKFEVDSNLDTEEDIIFESEGVRVIADEESVRILNGATVEYHVDLIRAGFRIVNIPQAEKGCSCGISFSIKL